MSSEPGMGLMFSVMTRLVLGGELRCCTASFVHDRLCGMEREIKSIVYAFELQYLLCIHLYRCNSVCMWMYRNGDEAFVISYTDKGSANLQLCLRGSIRIMNEWNNRNLSPED